MLVAIAGVAGLFWRMSRANLYFFNVIQPELNKQGRVDADLQNAYWLSVMFWAFVEYAVLYGILLVAANLVVKRLLLP